MKKQPTIIIIIIIIICLCSSSVYIGYTWGTRNCEESKTPCDCAEVLPNDNQYNVESIKTTNADRFSEKYLLYQQSIHPGTSPEAIFVNGGIFRKSDMIAILNSLPASAPYFKFRFGMETGIEEGNGTDERPFGQTFLMFEGGTENTCSNMQINEWHSGDKLILRSYGYCPTRCGGPGITE